MLYTKLFDLSSSLHFRELVPVAGKPGEFALIDHNLTGAIAYGTKEELQRYATRLPSEEDRGCMV